MPARRRLDHVLEPDFVANCRDLSMDELRERRRTAQEEETEQSFVRRMLQGRLDLLKAALRVRAGEAESLIESLPEVLADDGPRPQYGRLPRFLGPADHPWGRRDGDIGVTDVSLLHLDDMSDYEIRALIDSLAEQERKVSDVRRSLFSVIDTFQGEIARRYADGETTIDDLLEDRDANRG